MPDRADGPTPRRQLGDVLLIGGVAALVATPVVYRIRAAGAHAHAGNWLWPTWWMVVPLAVAALGALLARLPAS